MKLSDRQLSALLWTARLLLGATFVFSGFVKAVDPVGAGIKVGEYLHSWGMGAMADYASFVGLLLSMIEFMAGFSLLLAISPITTSFVLLIFMSLMTPFTLYIALANPVSDCGCFGEAIRLTNWETFFKNIILLSLAIIVFWQRKRMKGVYHKDFGWIPSLLIAIFILLIALHGYRRLPLFDFRPYRIGDSIVELRQQPKGSKADQYATTLVYERNGERKEFSLSNYPADDSTWTFVEQRNKLIYKGEQPKITDFFLFDLDGNDLTDSILTNPELQFLILAPHLETADDTHLSEINDLYDMCHDHGYGFYCVTASNHQQIEEWSEYTGGEYPYLQADETVLKTILRANPGLIALKDGRILGKWKAKMIPSGVDMEEYLANIDQVPTQTEREKNILFWITALPIIVLALLYFLQKSIEHLLYRFRVFRRLRAISRVINRDEQIESAIEEFEEQHSRPKEKEE